MISIKTLALNLLLLFTCYCTSEQTKHNLEAINTQVWSKFYEAFETLNPELMAKIHSKEMVRVAGGTTILDYETYINNYRNNYKNLKTIGDTRHIALRFFERINTNTTASERGVYKLTVNKDKEDEQSYYGQFHVILKKEEGIWMITLDYDSNENNTIGENQFLKAYAIDNLEPFIEN